MLNKQIAAALALLAITLAAGCATTVNPNADDKEAYEEPEYTTGSNIPHKGSAQKIDANTPEGRAILDQMMGPHAPR